jgi:hypothetical protein
VIQALEGNARTALEQGRYVTAFSLQNYLAAEIQRTLRKVFSKPVSQTPWVYGSQESVEIRSLSGFIKCRHRVPQWKSSATKSFVHDISQKEIEEEVEGVHGRIRAHMNYKRKDMLVDTGTY